ncbi:MAG: sodium:alanine symporter family protein [Candidatus Latescibacteria bacterium]|jgi:alanine or glycine:cation symporter, AGCS family|nr:sodium:alanine symporter family protein [Candidatus Latescibacterota bacterium]
MQEQILTVVTAMRDFVWGVPLLVLLVGTGLFLTVRLKGLQFTTIFHSLHLAFIKRKDDDAEGDISHFQALMTALAATVGTGNIAGVATAIAAGGPGALFWMWITGLVGMATKYAEAVLSVKYRESDESGLMRGGPMYYLANGLGWPKLGAAFALFAVLASFGIGNMTQSNSVADVLFSTFEVPQWATGLGLAALTGLVIIGGIKSIGRVTSVIVPAMIVFYMVGAILLLIYNISKVPEILSLVFSHAFTPAAASGGFAGATVRMAIQMGVARGVFSNESGLGSAGIAAAAAQTRDPVTQALVSMTQTFIDTLVVCTLTGFAIIGTGVWASGETGAPLTAAAFSAGLPGTNGGIIVAVGLVLFAYSTVLGWSYYGEKSIVYLLGDRAALPYRLVFCVFVGIGAVTRLDLVWTFSDLTNGLMAAPNLIGLIALSGVVASETRRYMGARRVG